MKTRIAMIVAAGLLLAGDAKEDVAKETKKLEGSWKVTSIEFSGQNLLGDMVRDLQIVIKGNQMTVKGDFPEPEKYGKLTIKIDPAANPKHMDVTITTGDDKDTVREVVVVYAGLRVAHDPVEEAVRLLRDRPLDAVLMYGMPALPSAFARLDHFADRVEGRRLQVRHQPVPGLNFHDGLQVFRGRVQLVRASLIYVAAMGILVLHRPEVLLKAVLEDFFGVEVHAPETCHARPPLYAAS
jgi:uncharacterized protein (TIGR03067 family)